MLVFYGPRPPDLFWSLRLGGQCPHCEKGTRYTLVTSPDTNILRTDKIPNFVASYACQICLWAIPVQWTIVKWNDASNFVVADPREILPVKEPFAFDHLPEVVRKEIDEALNCLSVGAYNGFAACCRRSIQSLCTNLGAETTTKVKKQIDYMAEVTGLEDDLKDLALQVMLAGHDGAHPHLPDMDATRAAAILSLLQDLTYELYTRPGKVKEAAALRKTAAEKK